MALLVGVAAIWFFCGYSNAILSQTVKMPFGSEVLLDVNLFNGCIFWFRVVPQSLGTTATLPFQPHVLELVLPDGVGYGDQPPSLLLFLHSCSRLVV